MGVPRPSPHNIWMTPRPSPPKTWIKIGVPSPSPHEIWMTPRPSPPKTCRCPNPTATRYRGVGIRTPRSSRTKPGVKIGAPTPSPHEIVESGSRSPISTQNNGVPKPTPRARRCQDGVARPISTPAGVCGGMWRQRIPWMVGGARPQFTATGTPDQERGSLSQGEFPGFWVCASGFPWVKSGAFSGKTAESSTSPEVSKTKMFLIGPKVILRCQLLMGPRPGSQLKCPHSSFQRNHRLLRKCQKQKCF